MKIAVFCFLLGILATITVTYCYRTYQLHNYIAQPITLGKYDTVHTSLSSEIIDLKVTNLNFAEKVDSLNKRLDDFLLFSAVIITFTFGY